MVTLLRATRVVGMARYRLRPPPHGHRHLLSRVSNRPDPRRRPGAMEYRCTCGYSTHA